jgi:hypothetical protein
VKRRTKIVLGGAGFGLAVASGIALATRSAQVGLHGAFWLSLVFMMWLDSRIAE